MPAVSFPWTGAASTVAADGSHPRGFIAISEMSIAVASCFFLQITPYRNNTI